MQLLAKFKQILHMGFRPTLTFNVTPRGLQHFPAPSPPPPPLVIGQFFDTMTVASIDK